MLRIPALLAVLTAFPACIIDGIPLPDQDDEQSVDRGTDEPAAPGNGLLSEHELYYSGATSPFLLVGVPGAALQGTVLVARANGPSGVETRVPAFSDGSFNMPLFAELGDSVTVRMITQAGDPLAAAQLNLTLPPPAAAEASGGLDADFNSAPSAGSSRAERTAAGTVAIIGPAGSMQPGIGVVCANRDNGATAFAYAQTDGSYRVEIPAQSGDTLEVFAVSSTSRAGGDAVTLTAP